MCNVFTCISENIEIANFYATVALSLLLTIATIIISCRQNKLQKTINNQQSQLQRHIAERETKIALYQYRMNCYLLVMEALEIACEEKLEDHVAFLQTGGLAIIKKVSEGKKMMLKAYIESEALFDEDVVKYIGGLYAKYDALYAKFCAIVNVSNDERGRTQQIADCLILVRELDQVFKPQNELLKLMEAYINMKDLNAIEATA